MSFSTSVPSFLSSLVTYAKFLLPYKAMHTVVLGIRVWTSLGHALQPSIPFNFILHNKLCNSCVALLCLWMCRSSWAQIAMTIHCLNAQEKGPGTWGSHKISNHGQLSLSLGTCAEIRGHPQVFLLLFYLVMSLIRSSGRIGVLLTAEPSFSLSGF